MDKKWKTFVGYMANNHPRLFFFQNVLKINVDSIVIPLFNIAEFTCSIKTNMLVH